jgi:drug/metabolite transporter (DMT)-like permease
MTSIAMKNQTVCSTSTVNDQKDSSKSLVSFPFSPDRVIRQFSSSFDEMCKEKSDSMKTSSPISVVAGCSASGSGTSVTPQQQIGLSPEMKQQMLERVHLPIAITAWYLFGVVSIVTTKVLLTDWQVPPLVVTFQQLTCGSCLLWFYLLFSQGGAQPWPWDPVNRKQNTYNSTLSSTNSSSILPVDTTSNRHYDFILTGLFNALDFLATNTAFAQSAASFVETIKASEPITTTFVALAWKVDKLGRMESLSLAVLIAGVILSTCANAEAVVEGADVVSSEEEEIAFEESFRVSATVMTANLCFAFRAMSQKFYRRTKTVEQAATDDQTITNGVGGQPSVPVKPQMDDINLLCRMQQMGAALLILPLSAFNGASCLEYLMSDTNTVDLQLQYLGLTALNAVCFSIYK